MHRPFTRARILAPALPLTLTLALATALATAACGGSRDYLNDPPGEAAEDLAQASCDAVFDCGVIEVSCDPPTAVRTPAEEVFGTQTECEADIGPIYRDILEGCVAAGLTDAQKELLNDCFNSQNCISDGQLQSYADAVCEDEPIPGGEACMRAIPVFTLCQQCADDPTDPDCHGPE